jgi:hypothetical protein
MLLFQSIRLRLRLFLGQFHFEDGQLIKGLLQLYYSMVLVFWVDAEVQLGDKYQVQGVLLL